MSRLEERFWSKVDIQGPDDCWLWQGSKNERGRGEIHVNRRKVKAPRVAYELTHGPFDPKLRVCHSCDNPRCVNPKHLWLGTQGDNLKDAVAKGRLAPQRTFGAANGAHTKPWRRPKGDRHGSRTRPDRVKRGEENGMSKLTESVVKQIRADYQQGDRQVAIAARYGVDQTTVSDIVRLKIWRHVQC